MTTKRVDISIAFYGKPLQTITTIKSAVEHSGRHIDKIYISREAKQPHDDWSGIYKVLDYFKGSGINIVVYRPTYYLGVVANDAERAKKSSNYRYSILHQYALEHTDKEHLCVMHNDILFKSDLIGAMLNALGEDKSIAGIGQIGQCWNCPAFMANLCDSTRMNEYVPTQQEAIKLHKAYPIPRLENSLAILERGLVHPLPECRLNEYCALINIPIYRKMTLPAGDVGCFGGNWGGSDTAAMWFYQMYNKGCRFKHFDIHALATHAAFDGSGSGSESDKNKDRYFDSEKNAQIYINANYPRKADFGAAVPIYAWIDKFHYKSWLFALRVYGKIKTKLAL